MTSLIRSSGALRPLLASLGFIALVLFLFSATASAQEEQLKSTVTAATERVSRQSYRWETRVSAGEVQTPANQNSPVVASGRKRADGYVLVDGLLSNANAEFVMKDGKSAVLSGGNWMTLEQAEERSGGGAARGRGGRGRGRGRGGAGGGGQSLGETINRFQTPASEALDLLKAASGFRSEGNTITASLTSEAATALFASTDNIAAGAGGGGRGGGGAGDGGGRGQGRGRGRGDRGRGQGRGENLPAPVVNIAGTVAYTISDAALSNLRVSLSSTETRGDDVTRTSREIVTDFKEIGAADVELAPDARDIVDALIAGVVPRVFVPEPGFRKLFNGRDLTGWAGREGVWTAEDGAIVGRTTSTNAASGGTSLVARDGDENLKLDNFELRFSYRLTPSNPSATASAGIQYRAQDRGNFVVAGYEADISTADGVSGVLHDRAGGRDMAAQGEVVYWKADGKKTVLSKLGDAAAIQAKIKQNDWNEYVIIASENRVQHFVNGVPTVDVTDADASHQLRSGVLALSLRAGAPTTAAFKDIRFRRVTPLAEAAAAILEVADGFQIEQLYQVPAGQEGSWVASCFDDKGRMIVSDQRGELYRFRLPAIGERTPIKPEPIGLGVGSAHGLLYAFNSLYSMGGGPEGTGLYRLRDTNGDDQYDEVRFLRGMQVGSDHSAHVPVLSPDGQSLYVISGNQTELTKVDTARVPNNMSEDHLLRRLDTGFASGTLAPGGWIARTDPNGEKWEFYAGGFRNEFDAAFNRDGELFTYDADMEWDIGAPWYRPTRVNHVISGADFGFREGAGKHPDYFFDTFGSVVDVGTGSPTGVAFGYGARFPAKYQEALYICDWSFGKVYAVHLKPAGASYTAEIEEFIAGQPLPVTDVIINPDDGAMYIIVGGRSTQSALYRITYAGDEPTELSPGPESTEAENAARQARALRKSLEVFHGHADPAAVSAAWPHLKSQDRALRHAARIALEWQPVAEWRERVLNETNARTAIAAVAALARASSKDEFHRKTGDPALDPALQRQILASLNRIDWNSLSREDRVDLLRTYQLVFTRLGAPDEATKAALATKLEPLFPAATRAENFLLSNFLVYLEAPSAAAKVMAQIRASQSQEEQVDYALALRVLKTGWTPQLREEYFRWFVERGGTFRGGNSFNVAMRTMHDDSVGTLSASERVALASIIDARPQQTSPQELLAARPVVREWTLEELVPVVETGLRANGRNFEQGRRLYGAVACAVCHRFANEGGAIGPDLTNLIGRFGVRDLMESIVHPSKVVSDQYGAVTIVTTTGRTIIGRIGNMNGNTINVVEDMFNAGRQTGISRDEVESLEPSPISMMPDRLLDTLTAEEIQDLVAYLYSRGAPDHEYFQGARSE